MVRCIVLPDAASVEAETARRLALQLARAQAAQGHGALALAGGTTPVGIYRQLAATAGVDWPRLLFFWGDERIVPPHSPHSNQRLAREVLLDHVPVLPSNIHPMRVADEDPERAAAAYEALLCALLGRPPRLDAVLLGLGGDAHTASLFPGSAAVDETSRFVVATPAPSIAPRLTLTLPALRAARAVFVAVHGADKAWALRLTLHGRHDPRRAPLHALRDGNVTYLVDRAAAGDLRPLP